MNIQSIRNDYSQNASFRGVQNLHPEITLLKKAGYKGDMRDVITTIKAINSLEGRQKPEEVGRTFDMIAGQNAIILFSSKGELAPINEARVFVEPPETFIQRLVDGYHYVKAEIAEFTKDTSGAAYF